MLYVRSLGIQVLGVTSERKIDHEYVCKERADPANKIVYVGKYNYFSKTTASPWAPVRADNVYYDPDDTTSENIFSEYL